MELALHEAETRLAELVTAAEHGERVVITRDGEPTVQLVRCERTQRHGLDWDRLNEIRRELGIEDASPEEVAAWKADFEDAAFSRRVLGLDGEEQAGLSWAFFSTRSTCTGSSPRPDSSRNPCRPTPTPCRQFARIAERLGETASAP